MSIRPGSATLGALVDAHTDGDEEQVDEARSLTSYLHWAAVTSRTGARILTQELPCSLELAGAATLRFHRETPCPLHATAVSTDSLDHFG